jgi:hypothetical protein
MIKRTKREHVALMTCFVVCLEEEEVEKLEEQEENDILPNYITN